MFYSQGQLINTEINKSPQSSTSNSTNSKMSNSLPSFSELLTSIPSRHNQKQKHDTPSLANSLSYNSFTSSATPSPTNYYSQPQFHSRTAITSPSSSIHQPSPSPRPLVSSLASESILNQPSVVTAPRPNGVTDHHQYQTQAHYFPPHAPVTSHAPQPAAPYEPVHFPNVAKSAIPGDEPVITKTRVSSPNDSVRSEVTSPSPPHSPASQSYVVNDRTHSPKEVKRKHVCKVCSRSFTTSGHLARHNRVHTGEKKHVCPWPICDARFARQDNCMQHFKTHTKEKNKKSKTNY